jgi:hypothetical protein
MAWWLGPGNFVLPSFCIVTMNTGNFRGPCSKLWQLTAWSRVLLWTWYTLNWSRITRSLSNPNVCYSVHSFPPLFPIINRMNPLDAITPYFLNIHFNMIPHQLLVLTSGLFPPGLSTKIVYISLCLHTCTMLRPSHVVLHYVVKLLSE